MPDRTSLRLRAIWAFLALAVAVPAHAQIETDPFAGERIEAIEVKVSGAGTDTALESRIADSVRKATGIFPGDIFDPQRLALALAQARRNPQIQALDYTTDIGPTGDVIVRITVELLKPGEAKRGPQFPIIFDRNGTIVKARLELLEMTYSNIDAWYGRPDAMLAGNPLVSGKPAGKGATIWAEGFVHAGIYGLTPINSNLRLYGGVSAIGSASIGRELFTDDSRAFLGIEDAFVGLVGGRTDEKGNRLVANVSVGRMRYSIGDGFLIANTASNGDSRAALQSNPRWAGDFLGLAQLRYNSTKIEAFLLNPDELPVVDSKTHLWGVNLETRVLPGLDVGFAFIRVPHSHFQYFTPTTVFGREGLRVVDFRMRFQSAGAGPFASAEFAQQENSRFKMRARAFQLEGGWIWQNPSLTLSYRYARFSGDDQSTSRFERWDPLLSGGNGEQWVQGINHFKIFQDSNLVAHRVQARIRPTSKTELVPQVWLFRSDELLNLGGNPALSFLTSKKLAKEVNLTGKWFVSRNFMLQGHIAATWPSAAEREALGHSDKPWVSAMLFARLGY